MLIPIVTGVIIISIVIVVSIAPGTILPETMNTVKTFFGLSCAHRGLYAKDQSIPENSLPAFAAAREKGYGIELDVHLTSDNQAVVFHDYDLKRACGVDRLIGETSYSELQELRLFGTDEKIPLLSEALDVIGDTPVIVEIKPSGPRNKLICQKTLEILRAHGKNWCIESFDPRICAWFKKNAPEVLRGQLSCPPGEFMGISRVSSVILGNMLLNSISRPHFIAYKNEPYPLIVKFCMVMKPIRAVWTVNSDCDMSKTEEKNDLIIFEHFIPAPRFK